MRLDGPNQLLRMIQPQLRIGAACLSGVEFFVSFGGYALGYASPLFTVFVSLFAGAIQDQYPNVFVELFGFISTLVVLLYTTPFTPLKIIFCPGTTTSLLDILAARQNTLLDRHTNTHNPVSIFHLCCKKFTHGRPGGYTA
jgi:hypothetical protein